MAEVNVGLGISQKDNLIEAAREAAQKAKQEIKGKKPKLLMFFCDLSYVVRYKEEADYEKAMRAIREIFPDKKIPLVGGTVLGFFAKNKYYFDIDLISKLTGIITKPLGKIIKPLKFSGVCVLALESPFLRVGTGIGLNTDKDPKQAGLDCIKQALSNLEYNPVLAYMAILKRGEKEMENVRFLDGLLLTAGTQSAISEKGLVDAQILEGINFYTKRMVKLIGGGLIRGGSSGELKSPFHFYNDKAYKNAVISVVFDSDLKIGYGVDTGAKIIEPVGIITKGKDWTIEEINNKPAFEVLAPLFEKHAGIKKQEFQRLAFKTWMKGWALAFSDPAAEFYWPLSIVGVKDKKVIVMDKIKQGLGLNLVNISSEDAQKATEKAAQRMMDDTAEKKFHFVFFFSCGGRAYILGTQYFKEIEAIKKTLKQDIPVFGICSVGEQAFYKTGQATATNLTITMFGISDKLR
ncbi:FIST C-terminal domain-containing protein [Candidatus Parcubacteria bacterium]|nr:FIST C-terminal domain-containing protein [Candidatus Parcubacteria bacterium]